MNNRPPGFNIRTISRSASIGSGSVLQDFGAKNCVKGVIGNRYSTDIRFVIYNTVFLCSPKLFSRVLFEIMGLVDTMGK